MLMSRNSGLLSRVEPAERRGSRHENHISRPSREPLGAETDVYDIHEGRMTWPSSFFPFLPPSWRNPESHVLKLPAVWFLVAEDVVRAHTNWPPFLCCSLSSLFFLLLLFPPPVFPFFSPFTHLRPCLTLTRYTSSASQSSVQGPGTCQNRNRKKEETVHLPAGHNFKDSPE